MKKVVLFVAFASTIAFSSCSKDEKDSCKTCEIFTVSTKLCGNDDGSITATVDGKTTTTPKSELGGLTPNQYIESLCAASKLLNDD